MRGSLGVCACIAGAAASFWRGRPRVTGMHAQILAACRAAADLPPIHVECQRVRLASKCLHRLPDLHMAAPLLRELDLSRNAFALFPAQLWELQSLEVLNLAHNQISVIEAAAPLAGSKWRGAHAMQAGKRSLLRCRSLDLSGNALRCIPASVLDRDAFPALTHLDMGGNPLTSLVPADDSEGSWRTRGPIPLASLSLGHHSSLIMEGAGESQAVKTQSMQPAPSLSTHLQPPRPPPAVALGSDGAAVAWEVILNEVARGGCRRGEGSANTDSTDSTNAVGPEPGVPPLRIQRLAMTHSEFGGFGESGGGWVWAGQAVARGQDEGVRQVEDVYTSWWQALRSMRHVTALDLGTDTVRVLPASSLSACLADLSTDIYIYIYIVGYVWYVGYCDAPLGCVCRYVGA